ncbi:hypothetical protein N7520_002484 [Penicillium odoratum]|uniref:uncharacterized protein n=1 Tax=Penicillium odoratum TaxID=1167516 RepID=UPI002546B5B4|nr:uncharacterized protein N7520_002484 [Penicillium odoratum]KAJ5771955.1 hypothetical protein N7520_002484 [Penicillium odoratum]
MVDGHGVTVLGLDVNIVDLVSWGIAWVVGTVCGSVEVDLNDGRASGEEEAVSREPELFMVLLLKIADEAMTDVGPGLVTEAGDFDDSRTTLESLTKKRESVAWEEVECDGGEGEVDLVDRTGEMGATKEELEIELDPGATADSEAETNLVDRIGETEATGEESGVDSGTTAGVILYLETGVEEAEEETD